MTPMDTCRDTCFFRQTLLAGMAQRHVLSILRWLSDAAFVAAPVRLTNVLLEHYAVGAARQSIDEQCLLGRLDAPELGPAIGQEFVFGQLRALVQLHHRGDRLAPLGMGDADDRTVLYCGVSPDDLFHFTGVDIEAAGDDEVLLAVGDVQVT